MSESAKNTFEALVQLLDKQSESYPDCSECMGAGGMIMGGGEAHTQWGVLCPSCKGTGKDMRTTKQEAGD